VTNRGRSAPAIRADGCLAVAIQHETGTYLTVSLVDRVTDELSLNEGTSGAWASFASCPFLR